MYTLFHSFSVESRTPLFVGTGLFLGSGTALANAGPLGTRCHDINSLSVHSNPGLLLGYALMGLITSGIAFISAETAAFLPVSGGFIRMYSFILGQHHLDCSC